MLPRKKFSALGTILLLSLTTIANAKAIGTSPNWRIWKGGTAPTISVRYSNGRFLASGKPIGKRQLLRDFRRLSEVRGHPVLVLTIHRGPTEASLKLMRQIESTGMCSDAGCFYKFN